MALDAEIRIPDTTLQDNDFKDGEILRGSDVNKIVSVLKAGVNENYKDLKESDTTSNEHILDEVRHITGQERDRWNNTYTKEELYTKEEVYNKSEVYNKNETYPKESLYTKEETYSKNETYPKENLYTKNEVYNKSETYPKENLYTKNEVYAKEEVYTKEETYSKNDVYTKDNVYTKSEVDQQINDRIIAIGSADMQKAVYDKNNNGIVDDSEKLGGKYPNAYALKEEVNQTVESIQTDISSLQSTVSTNTSNIASNSEAISGLQTDVSGLQTDVSELQTKSFEGTSGTIETKDGYLHDMMIFGKSVQDGTPTPENPIEIKSVVNPKVTVCGKNLLNPTLQTTTANGVTCTNNGDGTYTLNGTASETCYFYLLDIGYTDLSSLGIEKGKSYKFIGCPQGGNETSTYSLRLDANPSGNITDLGSGNVFILENNSITYAPTIRIVGGAVCNNVIFKPMLTTDLNATYNDFEPYKGQSATLPYTLNAIPVSSGGNVTINGQQYISDYVDIERKKLVRYIGEVDLGSIDWRVYNNSKCIYQSTFIGYKPPLSSGYIANALCGSYVLDTVNNVSSGKTDKTIGLSGGGNAIYVCDVSYKDATTFKNSMNGVKLIYELATPTETTLTDEEVAQFKALQTYVPTSSIIASSDVLNPLVKCDYSLNKETNNIYDRLQENASDVTNINTRLNGLSFVALTQTEYEALEVKDDNTIYFITEG